MTSNSIYIGLVLVAPIFNQKRYDAVFNEILQVSQNRFLIFQSATGSLSDQICLPLSCLYLHTCYFKLHSGFELTTEDKKFAAITWEVINILKENFPSKVFLSQENLELCKPHYNPMSSAEENRRQISCLMSLKEESRYMTFDEMEDAWHTLQTAEKLGDQRAINVCLELIAQQTLNWAQAKQVIEVEVLNRIISRTDYNQLTQNKLLAQDISDRINNPNTYGVLDQAKAGLENIGSCEDTISLLGSDTMGNTTIGCGTMNNTDSKGGQEIANYEKPTSTRMCLFQLTESNDINRVSMILETLSHRSKETLQQLRKRYNLSQKLVNILKKYCNAEYGFDQLSSRQGIFQSNLLKLLVVLTSDYVVFLEFLQGQTFEFLTQLIEEAVIYSYEDAIAGAAATSYQSYSAQGKSNQISGLNQELKKFLSLSLDFIELSISKQFQEFLPQISSHLRKIQTRMTKLIQKKDNPLLNLFMQNYTAQTSNEPFHTSSHPQAPMTIVENEINEDQLGVEQLSELKGLSEVLYNFAVELNNKVQKLDALVDLQEDFEEKHLRLFYRFNNGINYSSKPVVGQTGVAEVSRATTNAVEKQTKVQFEAAEPQRHKQAIKGEEYQRKTETRQDYDQIRKQQQRTSENKENLPYQQTYQGVQNSLTIGGGTFDDRESAFTSNVFKKNQVENPHTFKRVDQQLNHQYTYANHQSEKNPRDLKRGEHYIGSPIKPYQRDTNQYYTNYENLLNQERESNQWKGNNKYL